MDPILPPPTPLQVSHLGLILSSAIPHVTEEQFTQLEARLVLCPANYNIIEINGSEPVNYLRLEGETLYLGSTLEDWTPVISPADFWPQVQIQTA